MRVRDASYFQIDEFKLMYFLRRHSNNLSSNILRLGHSYQWWLFLTPYYSGQYCSSTVGFIKAVMTLVTFELHAFCFLTLFWCQKCHYYSTQHAGGNALTPASDFKFVSGAQRTGTDFQFVSKSPKNNGFCHTIPECL